MASHWGRWMIFEQNKLSLNLMCFELPRNIEFLSLQRQALPLWTDFLVRVVQTTDMWSFYHYSLEKHLSHDLGFLWYLPQYMEWTKYPWGQYVLQCTTLWAVLHKIFPIRRYCAFPHEFNWGKNHHQKPHEIEVRHEQFLGSEPDLLILRGVPTWVVQLCCLVKLNPRHKLDSPMCGDFKSNE